VRHCSRYSREPDAANSKLRLAAAERSSTCRLGMAFCSPTDVGDRLVGQSLPGNDRESDSHVLRDSSLRCAVTTTSLKVLASVALVSAAKFAKLPNSRDRRRPQQRRD